MKKLLLIGCLAVAGLSFAPSQASAWWLFDCCCSHHCSMKVCITPYNAFSPICAGNFCCVGCNPFCCGPQCGPSQMGCGPSSQPFCNSNCCESGCLPSTVPDGPAPTTVPPAPTEAPRAPMPNAQNYPTPMPQGMVNPVANYPQGYYPNPYNYTANPYNYAPNMAVPNYNNQSNYNPYAYGMNPYANMNPYGMNPYANMNPYGGMNPYGR